MRILFVVAAIFLSACTAAGGLKPTVMTAPPGYLESFPLGTVGESELISEVGPPDREMEIDGNKAVVYELGEGYGERTYTYILADGVVVDILYNDSGPYNGLTAKEKQSE